MPPRGSPTEKEILNIARRTTDIIENYITSNLYIFGSAASYLWTDIDRLPNVRSFILSPCPTSQHHPQDIDFAVWDEDEYLDPEYVKQSIVHADDRYYLEPSRRIGATHDILYCRLPGWSTDPLCRRLKIDILVPPTLNLPEIGTFERLTIANLPVMPLLDLLVIKTQGWWDHSTSERADYRAKVAADVSDIYALLDRASLEEDAEDLVEVWASKRTSEFTNYGFNLARRFVRTYRQPEKWRRLGFPL